MKTVDMKFMKKTLLVKVLQYKQNCIWDFLENILEKYNIFYKYHQIRIISNEKVHPFGNLSSEFPFSPFFAVKDGSRIREICSYLCLQPRTYH